MLQFPRHGRRTLKKMRILAWAGFVSHFGSFSLGYYQLIPWLCKDTYSAKQGWVIRRIHKIRRMVYNVYFTVMNKLGHIIRLQNLPFFAGFWPF